MEHTLTKHLFHFVENCPTAFHTAYTVSEKLRKNGYQQLSESESWNLSPGGKYFVTKNMSTIVAFRLPENDFISFLIAAPHGDAPCFKVKGSPEMGVDGKYTKLNTEVYGGMALNLWFDRPLSVAGRVMVRTETGVQSVLVNVKRDLFVIPSLAIHMNREANTGVKMNAQVDTLPLFGMEEADFMQLIAAEAECSEEDILSYDLYLYNRETGRTIGRNEEFILCPKLDDLQCTFSALESFFSMENSNHVTVLSVFDNEETGSFTKQGADSSFMSDILKRISAAYGYDESAHSAAVSASFILSADNGHAVHPNYPEKSDPTNRCYLNGGILIKNNVKYATDAVSSAVFRRICEQAQAPVQEYYNRSDVVGGSTLGNIISTHIPANTVDIGMPQLSMHSPNEVGGIKDAVYMVEVMKTFYSSTIEIHDGGNISISFPGGNRPVQKKDKWQDISSHG